MEENIEEFLEGWQLLIDAVRLPVFIVDENSVPVLVNRCLLELLDAENVEDLGPDAYAFLSPSSVSTHKEMDRSLFRDESATVLEARFTASATHSFPAKFEKSLLKNSRGDCLAILNTVHDQSELHAVKDSCQRCEKRHKAILDGFPAIIAQFNRNYEFVWANDKIHSLAKNDSITHFTSIFCPAGEQCPAEDVLKAALAGKLDSTVQQVGEGENERFFEIYGIPVDTDGATEAIIVGYEVTEKFKLEKQLRYAQKMEAIGTLAGGIAHDFNNVLTPIMGYSEILRFKSRQLEKPDPEFDEYVEEILRASRRAKGLVEQILTFSRSSEQKESLQYIHPIVKEVLKLLHSTLPSSIKFIEEIDENCGMAVVDPVLIHQVLVNLCTNSAHAMDGKHGTITVRLIPSEKNFEGRKWIELSVSDTGVGMEPGMIDRIFEPYFTTKEKEKGTGMGLAMVHGIIERQGGKVEVESSSGEGTRFITYLPVVENGVTTLESVVQVDELVMGSGGKLLLVDDDKQVVRVTGDLLISLGYEVTAVTSPVEAIDIFEQARPGTFSLVITDLTMPDMNGVELARKIKELHSSIPVILISGHSDQFSKDIAQEAGINAYCIKPLSLRELGRVVHFALNPAAEQGVAAMELGKDAFDRMK